MSARRRYLPVKLWNFIGQWPVTGTYFEAWVHFKCNMPKIFNVSLANYAPVIWNPQPPHLAKPGGRGITGIFASFSQFCPSPVTGECTSFHCTGHQVGPMCGEFTHSRKMKILFKSKALHLRLLNMVWFVFGLSLLLLVCVTWSCITFHPNCFRAGHVIFKTGVEQRVM
jgi:hypothetical protein